MLVSKRGRFNSLAMLLSAWLIVSVLRNTSASVIRMVEGADSVYVAFHASLA